MRSRSRRCAFLLVLGAAVGIVPGQGRAQTVIAYPNDLVSASPPAFTASAALLLGSPDNDIVAFSESEQATYRFGIPFLDSYDTASLASLIGVTEATLAAAELVAFDWHGENSGGGRFEGSHWTFEDGTNTLIHEHHFLDGPNGPVLANNERLDVGALYNSLFGTSFAAGSDFGVILFDLSGIDVANANFRVTLQGGGQGGSDIPDVTVLGAMRPSGVSAIGTGAMVALGVLLMLGMLVVVRRSSA